MCTAVKDGKECPQKDSCKRYLAKPSEYQSYFVEAPFEEEGCKHYWPIAKTTNFTKLVEI